MPRYAHPSTAAGNGADNGRAAGGKFAPGNKFGKGNPLNQRAQQIRMALLRTVTPERMQNAADKLLSQAEAGDRQAFAELCDRTVGRATTADVVERLERLESALLALAQGGQVPSETLAAVAAESEPHEDDGSDDDGEGE